MEQMLTLSSSPHVRSSVTVRSIMIEVLLAMVPAAGVAVYVFGLRALVVMAVTVGTCCLAEWGWNRLTSSRQTVGDFSAAVTGLLLAFNLPSTIPLWIAMIGGFFAVIIVKMFFGGIGKNLVNPALAARALLLTSWPAHMTHWTLDGVTTATTLDILKEGAGTLPSMAQLFIGNTAGSLGETSAMALLLGGLWLVYRKIIRWEVPMTFIMTVMTLTWLLGRNGFFTGHGIYEGLAGGLFLGAIFMATDYTTSPMSVKGRIVFAGGCGLLTVLIRLYGSYPEGVSYSILLMNLLVPIIDRFTGPKLFGEVKTREAKS
jgi:electron transport complex protein RnfD